MNNSGKDIIIRKITNKSDDKYVSLEFARDLLRKENIEELKNIAFSI